MNARLLVPPAAALVAVLMTTEAPIARAQTAEGACDVEEVEYALAASLRLVDTPLGKGDGTYAIGPGTLVLRIDHKTGRVQMAAYRMTEQFTIRTTALFWTTTVVTDTRTHATPNRCAVAAEGVLSGRSLRWATPVNGYATDGTLTCDGTLCGTFGAPPPGQSELHIAPHPVAFAPFEFAADGQTFTMASTFVSKTESPKQTAYVALAGRELKRRCVSVPACK
jgi:hypothetical protein